MSYKFSTGSIRKGDIYYEDDRDGEPTYIDFGQDSITLRPSGSQILHATPTAVGIGTTSPAEVLTLNATDPTIRFEEGGTFKATIGINSADNILIENKTMNKHIVFKANDQGTIREGLRLDGAVPEVVVNQQHGVGGDNSLIDFRVESENSTHMLFVSGGSDRVGIGISSPMATLHVHSDSIHGGVVSISQADNSGDASQLDLSKARGSGASPATVQNNDFVGQVRFLAYDGNSYDNFADMYAQAAGTISTTSHPTKIVMRTTKSSATSPTTAVTIDENQNVLVEGNLEVKDQITIRDQNAPASASSNGFRGEIRYDSNYIYVCIADNTWKRVALSSW
jgi:hypothetical protein